jgi:hypothetical protein
VVLSLGWTCDVLGLEPSVFARAVQRTSTTI